MTEAYYETGCHKATCGNNCCGLCCTKIENFTVTKGKDRILWDVNLHIHCGELTALIGPNGAGKSTLLKAILGEVKHTGEVKFLDAKGAHSGNPVIGYVPQHLNFDTSSPTSVLDLFIACKTNKPVWLFHTRRIREEIRESLERVKADHLIDKRLGALSGGELQRVLLALALEPVPDLLLLDEPVSGIDQSGLEMFYDTVSLVRRKYDLSIILVSHDLDLVAQYADRVVVLNGTIECSGKPNEIFIDEKLKKLFGTSWHRDFSRGISLDTDGGDTQ
jgi:zinc transport system ATP-binding protein